MGRHEVENQLLEVVKHAELHGMEVVGLWAVVHNTGNLSKHVESSVKMARREFIIGCLAVGITEQAILVVIPPGVLGVRRHIISNFFLRTLAPKTNMLLEMMYVAILKAICKPCCYNRFAMPEVGICPENVVIRALGAGMLFTSVWLEYLPVYFVQHLSVCLLLPIQPRLRNIVVLDSDRQESNHYDAVHLGHLADIQRQIANCHTYRPLILVASKI